MPLARRCTLVIVTLIPALLLMACTENEPLRHEPLPNRAVVGTDSLGRDVDASENRAVSFTNGRSAYFYTQTHRNDHEEHAAFRGLNIAQDRAFADIGIRRGGELLDPQKATARVYPDRLVRTWPDGVSATLRLVDDRDIVEIEIDGATEAVEIAPAGDGVELLGTGEGVRYFTAMEPPGAVILAGNHGTYHYLVVSGDRAGARAEFRAAGNEATAWRADRRARLDALLNGHRFVQADDPGLTQALRWLAVTTDQLVTRQRGDGIYAGLPWFNEYWGRDSFIALPGALLVTGEFETARAVLASFAEFMDMDPGSEFYGRVPNIVQPDALDYHTTDGTPRFVIALHDYVRYTGDAGLAEELYPKVRASIEGALANWTDEHGYLTHAENETWMDARRASDLAAYSPRDDRANDIQALWHGQLLAGVHFARVVGDLESAARWQQAAVRLSERFERDFASPDHDWLADRLTPDGSADFSLRPNQFYAFDLLRDRSFVARATRAAWQGLVYPWGVASLAADDPFFHPYHLAWDRYHKDEAYHNGTVWLWNNGIAMQRMVELGQVEPAWALFRNMNHDVLERGVVGGLGENTDAWPHPGEDWPRLTGTYLQAWSNTEQLRAWYQWFLGVRPDMVEGRVTLAPRLPSDFGTVDFTARVGAGRLRGFYRSEGESRRYAWVLDGTASLLSVSVTGFDPFEIGVSPGERIDTAVAGENLRWTHRDGTGMALAHGSLRADPGRLAAQAAVDRLFEGVGFARPGEASTLPVMAPGASGPGR